MPTTEAFSFGYSILEDPPDGSSTYGSPAIQNYEFRDTADGTSDGMTAIGGSVELYISGAFAGTFTVWWFTASGDPIMEHSSGGHAAYSNNGFLIGTNVGPVTTGTYLYCFGEGTLMETDTGQCAVETLQIGDVVQTADGRAVAVKWIGSQTIRKLFSGARAQLVQIRAGALGCGLPTRDLTVTGDHGMVLDGLVINASALVNCGSVDWVPLAEIPDRFMFYHVETQAHDVILADGTASETFEDVAGRMEFDNHQEYLDLYGAERIIPEMARPRISSRRLLPETIRARLGISDDVWESLDGALSA